jgi:hypothetical protein
MAKRPGAERTIGIGVTSTWGTAAEAGAGGKIVVESFDILKNPEILNAPTIGSGKVMLGTDSQQGQTNPTVPITKHLNFNDAGNELIAQFFGGASLGTIITGEYSHSIMYESTQNAFFCTVAEGATTTEVREAPSVSVQGLTFSASSFPGPIQVVYDTLASERKIASTTNTTATLDAATIASEIRVIADTDDTFRLNAQAGDALDADDNVSITGFTLTFNKQQELGHEMSGVAGNGAPSLTGDPVFKATVQVTVKNLEDFTYFTAENAGTAYKGSFIFTGSQIASQENYGYQFYFPCMKILEEPTSSTSAPADNPLTVTFECMQASSDPTGMIDVYPYILIYNDKSAAHLVATA